MQKIAATIARFPLWIALIAGGLSALGFAPWGIWPLTLACFALLIHLVAIAPNKRRAFLTGWLFGVGHFTIGNQWIAVAFTFQAAMPVSLGYGAVVALSLYLAVYPALATLGAWWISSLVNPPRHGEVAARSADGGGSQSNTVSDFTPPPPPVAIPLPVPGRISIPLILAFAGCWIITEWLRAWVFTGFVWNPLSAAFFDLSFFSMLIGTYGVSGLVIVLGGALCLLVLRSFKGAALLLCIVAAFYPPTMLMNLGRSKGYLADVVQRHNVQPATVTIVQPNISQADKYAPGYDAINFDRLARFSHRLPDQRPRLILWPEAAIPDYIEDGYPYRYYQFQPGESAAGARARLMTLMREGDLLVMGSNRLVIEQGQLVAARNSVSAMDANGKLIDHYNKAHLVPYGEYLPIPWLLRPLGLARLVPGDLDFWPGPGARTMALTLDGKPVKIGMQICYEIIFSGEVVDRKHRPDFIFNPSNDAWFGDIGPPQFLEQARLRAVEEGLPVVRATPTGISAIIDADGRIVKSLPMHQAGRIDAKLPFPKYPTLFARYGNILPLAFAALLIAFALLPLARRRASR